MQKIILLFLILTLTACEQATQLPSPFQASNISGKMTTVASAPLLDHNQKTRQLSEFKGKVTLVFFGYTHCPDICPTTLADLTQLNRLLGENAAKVQMLFVSVDPARDTPEHLSQYMTGFDSRILALTGSPEQVQNFAKQFNVSYEKQELENGYYIDHTTGIFILDPQGKIRLHAPHAQQAERLLSDIHLLLKGV